MSNVLPEPLIPIAPITGGFKDFPSRHSILPSFRIITGIPFNIIFGPKAPEGIPLPEILTIGALEEAFEKAGLASTKKEDLNRGKRRFWVWQKPQLFSRNINAGHFSKSEKR